MEDKVNYWTISSMSRQTLQITVLCPGAAFVFDLQYKRLSDITLCTWCTCQSKHRRACCLLVENDCKYILVCRKKLVYKCDEIKVLLEKKHRWKKQNGINTHKNQNAPFRNLSASIDVKTNFRLTTTKKAQWSFTLVQKPNFKCNSRICGKLSSVAFPCEQ